MHGIIRRKPAVASIESVTVTFTPEEWWDLQQVAKLSYGVLHREMEAAKVPPIPGYPTTRTYNLDELLDQLHLIGGE